MKARQKTTQPRERTGSLPRDLTRRVPLAGGFLRKRAAARYAQLALSGNNKAVRILALVLCDHPEGTLRQIASGALRHLTSQAAVNTLCAVWAERRAPPVEQVLLQAGYVADFPPSLQVLTAAKTGSLRHILSLGDTAVEPLLECLDDPDPGVRAAAERALASLSDDAAQQAFCRYALRTGQRRLLDIARASSYAPAALHTRALFYVLTEKWKLFEELDWKPDRPLLHRAYAEAAEPARRALFEVARRCGRSDVVASLVLPGRRRLNARDMTCSQWESIVCALNRDGRWDELWQICFLAPLPVAAAALRLLHRSPWKAPPHEREVFQRLGELCPPASHATVALGTKCAAFEGLSDSVEALTVSPSGSYLLGAVGHTVRLWDLRRLKHHRTLHGHRWSVSSLCVTPDERVVASAGKDRTIRLWSLPGGKPIGVLTGHRDWIQCLALRSDGALLASASKDSTARLWSVPGGRHLATLRHGQGNTEASWVLCCAFAREELLLTGSKDSAVRVWDTAGGQRRKTLEGHRGGVLSLAVSPCGTMFATGCNSGTVQWWTLPEGGREARFSAHQGAVLSLSFTPDGRFLLSGGADGVLAAWDLTACEVHRVVQTHNVAALALTPDGSLCATAGSDGVIQLWRLPDLEVLATIAAHSMPIRCLAITPDGSLLASGGQDKAVRLWSFNYLKPLAFATYGDLEAAQAHLAAGPHLTARQAQPWRFLKALLEAKFRYDIHLERPVVRFEPYDIEIDISGDDSAPERPQKGGDACLL